jgi:hypothetical protein
MGCLPDKPLRSRFELNVPSLNCLHTAEEEQGE